MAIIITSTEYHIWGLAYTVRQGKEKTVNKWTKLSLFYNTLKNLK